MNQRFLWGAATSSHQVEGNNQANDWWTWEMQGKVKDRSARACDHYHRFHEDFQIASDAGHTAHRFSLEWSRLEPSPGVWNKEAVDHYKAVFEALKSRGMEPVVTLHHFTNPQWFSDRGGWTHPESAAYFSAYVQRVIETFGRDIRYWITINEPLIYVYFSFLEGSWPPGQKSFRSACRAMRNLLAAHIDAYQCIHRHYERLQWGPVWVSIAKHVTYFEPCRKNSWADKAAVWLRNWFFNHLFIQAAQTGFLFFPGIFCESFPATQTLDFIGLNYYSRSFIRFKGIREQDFMGEMCSWDHHPDRGTEKNDLDWDIYPQGLSFVLKDFKRYRLPVMICENGICTGDDEQRSRYILGHLNQARRAMREGVDLRGYFYWSLLDNFEWAHGFAPRFGIVEVNYENFSRKIRKSSQVLSDLCRIIQSERG
ncbi:family 1 glycosylhydrolase [Omnitrophica bacterium]|nr:family 1 glycosylhydrolase [Candidatus Omnitrophota bacterium]